MNNIFGNNHGIEFKIFWSNLIRWTFQLLDIVMKKWENNAFVVFGKNWNLVENVNNCSNEFKLSSQVVYWVWTMNLTDHS